jgi:hypothetical protein
MFCKTYMYYLHTYLPTYLHIYIPTYIHTWLFLIKLGVYCYKKVISSTLTDICRFTRNVSGLNKEFASVVKSEAHWSRNLTGESFKVHLPIGVWKTWITKHFLFFHLFRRYVFNIFDMFLLFGLLFKVCRLDTTSIQFRFAYFFLILMFDKYFTHIVLHITAWHTYKPIKTIHWWYLNLWSSFGCNATDPGDQGLEYKIFRN